VNITAKVIILIAFAALLFLSAQDGKRVAKAQDQARRSLDQCNRALAACESALAACERWEQAFNRMKQASDRFERIAQDCLNAQKEKLQ
jgi:hypothetical protein